MDATIQLTQRQLCDLELLLNGSFAPITQFLCQRDYESVCQRGRLADNTLWPIPVTLDVSESLGSQLNPGDTILLVNQTHYPLAKMVVDEIWQPDKRKEAELVYGTQDEIHPGVRHLLRHSQPYYISGPIERVNEPLHYDFLAWRQTPQQVKEYFANNGWQRIIGFQTRNPIHKAHFALTMHAARELEANLLLHPAIGPTQPHDIDYATRVRCYEAVLPHYPEQSTLLALLPLAMRMAGPREALWHALIRKNYGCTHFLVGRQHACPRPQKNGEPFYRDEDIHQYVSQHAKEAGIEMVLSDEMIYLPSKQQHVPSSSADSEEMTHQLSGTKLRQLLYDDKEVPEWFTFPEVLRELKHRFPPKHRRGLCIFITGLSAAGKSQLAHGVAKKLNEIGERSVSVLDGDIIRNKLSTELGFTQHDRAINLQRISYITHEIVKHGGIAICAVIAPYQEVRQQFRDSLPPDAGFIEVYAATPIEVCEKRDYKGLYEKAKRGEVPQFSGISDRYDPPQHADLVIDNSKLTPLEAAQEVLLKLAHLGFIKYSPLKNSQER